MWGNFLLLLNCNLSDMPFFPRDTHFIFISNMLKKTLLCLRKFRADLQLLFYISSAKFTISDMYNYCIL